MAINCQLRPDYAEPTRRLISDTWSAHQAGGGDLPVENFLAMLGGISEEDRVKLATRGPIKLTPTHTNGGTFINEGPTSIEISYMDVKLRMPTVVKAITFPLKRNVNTVTNRRFGCARVGHPYASRLKPSLEQ